MNDINIKTIYEKFIEDGYRIAKEECKKGYADIQDCSWYHGNWMLLRYLDMVSNPYWHESFYRNALEYVDAINKKSLLIVGTADFSMPLLCSQSGVSDINVCDLCKTPLQICNKVSDYLGCEWNMFTHDISKETPLKYDIIINDAFLSRFVNKDIPLQGIYNSLKTNGYYITTLKKGAYNWGGDVSIALQDAFLERLKHQYNNKGKYLPYVNVAEICETYISKMSSYPVKSKEEIHTLFSSVGFDVISVEDAIVQGEYESSKYYRIISQKPKHYKCI